MLCGELRGRVKHPNLDYCSTRSPYSTLLSLYTMAAITSDEDILFLENGLLSYENPNYHLPRLDDALNSNTDVPVYKELLYKELEAACRNTGNTTSNTSRRSYATLNLGTMGVDVNTGPLTHMETDNRHHRDSCPLPLDNNISGNVNRGNCRTLDLTSSIRSNQPDLIEHSNIVSDLGKIVCRGNRLTNDGSSESFEFCTKSASSSPVKSPSDDLPPGWERHQDMDGPYYWHIKSGTIQRDAPVLISGSQEPRTPLVKDAETALSNFHQGSVGLVTRSNTSSALEELDAKRREEKKDEMALKRRSYPARWDREKERAIRFAVRSLGWVDISEVDLTPERSSKAVNKCIVELSLGKNGLIDNVGRWGDGKDLFMDLDEGALKLIDPENLTVLNTQPIHTIRVWGVGRDNGRERDFAYVARDRTTRKHMCHVFRCDMPARTIANTLRDICKKIMIERSLQQSLAKPVETSNSGSLKNTPTRPTNLPTEHRRINRNMSTTFAHSFPTPMEEPKKVLVTDYLGSVEVDKASGMEVLNSAIDRLMDTTPRAQWHSVNIAVAPSMITISSVKMQDDAKPLAECRVRYLSFLGIGHDVKNCAFIMHTAQDLFVAHVFHCEPSSGALCKTIEAACKLRYQKCLDAHPQSVVSCDTKSPSKGFGATLKSLTGQLVGSFTGKRSKHS